MDLAESTVGNTVRTTGSDEQLTVLKDLETARISTAQSRMSEPLALTVSAINEDAPVGSCVHHDLSASACIRPYIVRRAGRDADVSGHKASTVHSHELRVTGSLVVRHKVACESANGEGRRLSQRGAAELVSEEILSVAHSKAHRLDLLSHNIDLCRPLDEVVARWIHRSFTVVGIPLIRVVGEHITVVLEQERLPNCRVLW